MIEETKEKNNFKLGLIFFGTLAICGLIFLIPKRKKDKPKLPIVKPAIRPKSITKTITITPTEKTEEVIEEEELDELLEHNLEELNGEHHDNE